MFEQLRPYSSVAWDFDDTLVNHPLSRLFWQFIRENPYDQTHHIVTMRSHGMQETIFHDLARFGSDLQREHFNEVVWLEDQIWIDKAVKERHLILVEEDDPYYMFKGEACKRIGADILIDDMEDGNVSVRGCEKHGIPYLHPDDLIP
jgi:hypothetical protein